jgi:hypothetical protein
MIADLCPQALDLLLRVGLIKFAALGEIANVRVEVVALGEQVIGELEQFLKITVPGGEVQGFVEHRYPVDHVVEGNPQFLLTLADLVQQPRILHRDDRLRGKVLQQRNLLVGKRPNLTAVGCDVAEQSAVLAQWHSKKRAHSAMTDCGAMNGVVRRFNRKFSRSDIGDLNEWLTARQPVAEGTGLEWLSQHFRKFFRHSPRCDCEEVLAISKCETPVSSFAECVRFLQDRVKNRG